MTFDGDAAARLVEDRLRACSRIQLRDLALHVGAIAGTSAEVAADKASDDDVESLVAIDAAADVSTAGGARRAVSRFALEVAAISQSPRLVREEVRLQAEASPLLWMCLRDQGCRDRSAGVRSTVIAAIRRGDPAAARVATVEHIGGALDWLLDEKLRLETGEAP